MWCEKPALGFHVFSFLILLPRFFVETKQEMNEGAGAGAGVGVGVDMDIDLDYGYGYGPKYQRN